MCKFWLISVHVLYTVQEGGSQNAATETTALVAIILSYCMPITTIDNLNMLHATASEHALDNLADAATSTAVSWMCVWPVGGGGLDCIRLYQFVSHRVCIKPAAVRMPCSVRHQCHVDHCQTTYHSRRRRDKMAERTALDSNCGA